MIRTLGDLYREYARVVDMCDGTNVSPNECVRYPGHILGGPRGVPCLGLEPIEPYTFAVGIVGGRPVFHGDVLYDYKKDRGFEKVTAGEFPDEWLAACSWIPPKRTIDLHALPIPLTVSGAISNHDIILRFHSEEDSTEWLNAIIERIES